MPMKLVFPNGQEVKNSPYQRQRSSAAFWFRKRRNMFNDIKTKICSKCGKELPVDQFRFGSSNGYKYYRSECKECEKKYRKSYDEHQQKVTLPDKKDFLIHRKFKVIRPERILDVSSTGISLVADDEVFVKLMYCKDSQLWADGS